MLNFYLMDLQKLVPYVIRSLLHNEVPRLSSGRRRTDFVYIDDVVEGFLSAVVRPDIEGEIIEIGSGALISIRDLVTKIQDLIRATVSPACGTLAGRPLGREYVADIAHSRAALGWIPQVALDEGLVRTVQWYEQYFLKMR